MKRNRRLGIIPTAVICGLAFLAYKIFRTPELDHEIEKFSEKEAAKQPV